MAVQQLSFPIKITNARLLTGPDFPLFHNFSLIRDFPVNIVALGLILGQHFWQVALQAPSRSVGQGLTHRKSSRERPGDSGLSPPP